jgi:hypothetical protein
MDLKELVPNAIVKLRGATGWRSADLAGMVMHHSFKFKSRGVDVRTFSTKSKKGKWTDWVFIPRLADKWKELCAVEALERLHEKIARLELFTNTRFDKIEVIVNGEKMGVCPFFIYELANWIKPYRPSTISNKFVEYLLDNVVDSTTNEPFSAVKDWNAHSCRNAVASLLHAMNVPLADMAAHMCCSQVNLETTYIRTIVDPSEYPRPCIDKFSYLAAKLLVPSVHYFTLQHNQGTPNEGQCGCESLLQVPSNSSM